MADKLETLVGMFGIGQTPTGDKDPFALRRQALGVARILMERTPTLGLSKVVELATDGFQHPTVMKEAVTRINVEGFIRERLEAVFRERNYTFQEVDAVLSKDPDKLAEVPERIEAVRSFGAYPSQRRWRQPTNVSATSYARVGLWKQAT